MATYTNQLLVLDGAKTRRISASDNLVIGGEFSASQFNGSAAGLTSIPSGQLTGALPALDASALISLNASNISSGELSDSRLSSNVAKYNDAAPNFTNTVTASAFSGNGSALTNLSGSNIASGTVAAAYLPATIAYTDAASTTFSGPITASQFNGSAAGLTSIPAGQLTGALPALDGSALTSLDASNVSSGTLADARLSANVPLKDVANVFTNSITATSFSGSAVGLTGIPAEHVTGAGLLPDSVLSANVAKYDDSDPTFTNNVTANAFIGSGSALSDINASNITGGTLVDARLSSNIPRLNAASNTFDGNLNVGGNLNVTGNIVSAGSASVIVKDAFLDLNAGNTVFGSQLAGGLAVNVECLSASAFVATDFVAGVAATSNPTVEVTGDASGLAAGDLIQISGTTDASNDGQFVVLSTSGSGPTVITVKGVGTTAINAQTPFAHNQFVAQSSESASLVKIRVSALAATNGVLADADGAFAVGGWCYASGAAESAFVNGWTNLDPTASATLQNVYDNSATGLIEINAAKGGFTIQPAAGQTGSIELAAGGAGASAMLRGQDGADTIVTSWGAGYTGVGSDTHISITANTYLTLQANTKIQIDGLLTNAGANGGSLAQYTMVAYDSTGDLVAADADTADVVPVGVVYDGSNIYSTAGMKMRVLGATSTAWLPGATLYLANEAGKVTDVVPTSGRIYVVGMASAAYTEGVDAYAEIRWAPQYIADL